MSECLRCIRRQRARTCQTGALRLRSFDQVGNDGSEKNAKRHKILRKFLLFLGVPLEIAERDACVMEHILSKETRIAIEKFNAEKRKNT